MWKLRASFNLNMRPKALEALASEARGEVVSKQGVVAGRTQNACIPMHARGRVEAQEARVGMNHASVDS